MDKQEFLDLLPEITAEVQRREKAAEPQGAAEAQRPENAAKFRDVAVQAHEEFVKPLDVEKIKKKKVKREIDSPVPETQELLPLDLIPLF